MWAKAPRLWLKATSVLVCVIAALATGCADEPRAVDPARLPESIDVGPLRGRALPETPCRFADDLAYGSSGSGVIRVWLECPETKDGGLVGFVEVASVLTGYEPAEDSIRCRGDAKSPTLHSCDTRHGMITVNTRAWGALEKSNPEEARELVARVVQLLATLPEQPCRLCPQFLPPHRRAELTRMFSGTGPKQLGTIELQVDSRIRYVAPQRGIRVTSGRPPRVLVEATHHQGEADMPRGTYRKVKVSASDDWNFLIEPR